MTMIRLFRHLVRQVKKGITTELDAARKILEAADLTNASKISLSRSCTFAAADQHHPRRQRGHHHHHRRHQLHPRGLGGLRHYHPHHHQATTGLSSDGHGNTPLHWSAFKNETECVSLLLSYGANPNAAAHPSGWTPLHDAAYSNSKECIDLLIQAGASVDARANSGATPLCFAAQEDAAGAAALLLERGANLSTRCAGGPIRDDGTPAPVPTTATTTGHNNNLAQQQQHPHSRFSGYTPLHYCAHYNAHQAAKVLLRHPTAVRAMEIPDLNDRLPIHVAVARGSADVLRELLHAGARVETRMRVLPSPTPSSDSIVGSAAAVVPVVPAVAVHGHGGGVEGGAALTRPRPVAAAARNPGTPSSRRRRPAPEHPSTPRQQLSSGSLGSTGSSSTPVSSPILRSMIPSQPVVSSKPWNCLTQRSIDECRSLISQAEMHWSIDRHDLFTPADRRAVREVLMVGKRLEQNDTGIFVELWPTVLSFCGRGWFDVPDSGVAGMALDDDDDDDATSIMDHEIDDGSSDPNNDGLSLPNL